MKKILLLLLIAIALLPNDLFARGRSGGYSRSRIQYVTKTVKEMPEDAVKLDKPTDGFYQVQVVFKKADKWLGVIQLTEIVKAERGIIEGKPIGEFILVEIPGDQVDPKIAPFAYYAVVKEGKITLQTVSELRQRP